MTITTRTTTIPTNGPFSLREAALLGFGHREEQTFDGVLRLAFCSDDDLDVNVGVEVRQHGDELELAVHAPAATLLSGVQRQVARVLSCDHDGNAFAALGRREPVIGRLQAAAPGLRPTLFYSPYEAAVWSVISARRSRAQGIALRERLCGAQGTVVELAGEQVPTLPGPRLLGQLSGLPGLPADRIPRLHAIAQAAVDGRLDPVRLTAIPPEEAMAELQVLPGIGPFYSSLIVVRACGLADVPAPGPARGRAIVRDLYGVEVDDDAGYLALAESWRPFRTWAAVLIRAAASRLHSAGSGMVA